MCRQQKSVAERIQNVAQRRAPIEIHGGAEILKFDVKSE